MRIATEGTMVEPRKSRPAAADSPARAAGEEAAELDRLRRAIDALDRQILDKLNERARLVGEVGRHKQATQTPVYAAARERDIVTRLARENPGPFPNEGLPHVFREIISATRSLEEVVRVAYLGPEGTFSHVAARRQFGGLAEFVSVPTIAEVFAAVERKRSDLGIVPIENTTEGAVTQTFDAFVESDLTICGEQFLLIGHHLLSQSGRREDIRRVASHPQPIAQCRLWLDRNLPGVERVETASTSSAARLAVEDPGVAAIGSSIAGEAYGLETVEANIEDHHDNTSRFLVVGREPPPPSGKDLTSVVYTTARDEPGTLHTLLEPFARAGVNLSAIQCRPMKGRPWEYLFFLDFEGHAEEPRVAKALKGAAAVVHSHKILGSFPRAHHDGGGGAER